MGIMQALMGSYGGDRDPYWNDVILLMNGSDQTTDLSSVNQSSSLINRNGSGTGNGTSTGVTTATRTGPTGYGTVDVLRFDGTSSFIESSYSGFNDYNQDFTIEGWYYPTSNSGARTFFSQWDGDNNNKGGIFGTTINGEFLLLSDDPPGTEDWNIHTWVYGTNSSIFMTLNDWNHVAVTRSGDTFRIFANGAVAGFQTETNFDVNISGNFTIGCSQSTGSGIQHFEGDAFDIRVTMGVARYTADFSSNLPTAPFPTA